MKPLVLSFLILALAIPCGAAAKPSKAKKSKPESPSAAETNPGPGEEWKGGKVQVTLDAPFDKCVKAVEKTAADLKLKLSRRTVDGLSAVYFYRTADRHLVRIDLKKVSEKSTAAEILSRRSAVDDPELTAQVLREIRKNLGGQGSKAE